MQDVLDGGPDQAGELHGVLETRRAPLDAMPGRPARSPSGGVDRQRHAPSLTPGGRRPTSKPNMTSMDTPWAIVYSAV